MSIVPFFQIVGRRAAQETRTVIVSEGDALPAGSYAFMEFYCTDRACDCRRVIFQVWREDTAEKIWATITYGWDTPEYYARWSHCGMGAEAEEMASATLEPMSQQSALSPYLLRLFTEVLLRDADYVERLKRHYQEASPGRKSRVTTGPVTGGSVRSRLRLRRRKL